MVRLADYASGSGGPPTVDAMTDSLENLATVLLLFLVVPMILLGLYSNFAARRARAAHARELAEFERRLREPHFEELERHFGRALPESFKRLHRNPESVSRTDFALSQRASKPGAREWHVAGFLPADGKTLADAWSELGQNNLPLGCDEEGNTYYVPLEEATEFDGPVWRFHHEGGERERVADSLAEFLSWPARSEA